jgi:DNA-binding transcriptional MerR regulator
MEHLTAEILRRSSDVVVIVGSDGGVLDVNEAFFTATGHARHELVGRPGHDLLVGFERTTGLKTGALERLGAVAGAPIGLWTRSGELRVGDLSTLELQVEGEGIALWTIRGLRDPTPRQRRALAREELDRVPRGGAGWPGTAIRSLLAFGSCLRWDFGALWRGKPRMGSLRCIAVWRSLQSDLERLEDATRDAAYPPGMESLHRSWMEGEPTWIPDVSADAGFMSRHGGVGEPVHGWLGFPALGRDGIIGVVEFVSREIRQPDAEFLGMVEDFGRLFGQVIQDSGVGDVRPLDDAATVPHAPSERQPEVVPAAFRDLAGAVAAAAATLQQRPPTPDEIEPPAQLGELTARIDKLNRLLEGAAGRGALAPALDTPASPAQPAERIQGLPTGLTLKAVSLRTGIPAATLRTWEHRYQFMRPPRSSTGYRLYGEDEIARIEQVKYLVSQGVRVGAAMKAVIEQAEAPPDEGVQDGGRTGQPDDGADAEVYRLASRVQRSRHPQR